MSASHQREAVIFDAAMELPPERRSDYLDEACGGDAALRQRVASLLKASETRSGLLDSPACEIAPAATVALPVSEKPGDTIGRYKLLQQIGEGGCGVVYMAEQVEPVRRRVALKVIKLGMDTKSVIARFEAERQALALMDHPNIAKVFDAGSTETGRPYFVMELVRGMKITEYCDEKRLSTRQRLDLFIQVCHAIQHAHQKGIIHRDIKPSNILVSVNDGVVEPKVIDFGIAKATGGQQLTGKTLFTAFEQFIGTPAYMSPEQAVLTNVDIDTRSDIYALGVLLYELLTGKTPFDAKELLAIGFDEMRRTIREQEPSRPSTRLSTLADNELSTAAQRRGLEAPKLVSELRGDLDWIVMKALEKDRARRYETANGLAADIRRHLDDEPVIACPPSGLYRLMKTIRRHKLGFAVTGAFVVSLALGTMLAAVSWFREREARRHADEQGAIARAVSDFLQEDLLLQASSYAQADARFTPDPNLTVRDALDRAAARIGKRFDGQQLQEAAVRMAIGQALIEVGEPTRAQPHLERALELRRASLGALHPDTLTSMHHVANAYRVSGEFDRALSLMRETVRLRSTVLTANHTDTLMSMGMLGVLYLEAGKVDEALPILERTLKARKTNVGSYDRGTIRLMGALANAYRRDGNLQRAIQLQEETLKLRLAISETNHPETLLAMGNLAGSYSDARNFDRALPLAKRVLELRTATLGPGNPETLRSMFSLATLYSMSGKVNDAVTLLENTLSLQRTRLEPGHPDTLNTMNNLGIAYIQVGRLDQARRILEETLRLVKSKTGWDPQHVQYTTYNLENVYRLSGALDQLEAMYRERLSLPGGDGLKAGFQVGVLLLEKAAKTKDEPGARKLVESGEQMIRDYLAGARELYSTDPLELASRICEVADFRYHHGHYAEGEALYREVIRLRGGRLPAGEEDVLEAKASLARLLSDWAWVEHTNAPAPGTSAERAREAESHLREVLSARLVIKTNSSRIAEVKSSLGAALVSVTVTDPAMNTERRIATFTEAEALLRQGCEGWEESTDQHHKGDALVRLVRLYEAWNRPDQRAEWQQKLELFDNAAKLASGPGTLMSGNPESRSERRE